MKHLKRVIIAIILGHSVLSHGQEIIKLKGNAYTYENVTYKFSDLDDIFVLKEYPFKTYQAAKANLQASRTLGTLSLISVGVGALGLLDNTCSGGDFFCIPAGRVVTFITWGIIFPATGAAGIITRAVGNKLKRESIDQFNQGAAFGYMNTYPSYVSYGVTNNGIGIIYNF